MQHPRRPPSAPPRRRPRDAAGSSPNRRAGWTSAPATPTSRRRPRSSSRTRPSTASTAPPVSRRPAAAERVEEAHAGRLTDPQITARLQRPLRRGQRAPPRAAHPGPPRGGRRRAGPAPPRRPPPARSPRPALRVRRAAGQAVARPTPAEDPPLTPLDDLRGELESRAARSSRRTAARHTPPRPVVRTVPAPAPLLPPWLTRSLLTAAGATDHALAPVLRRTRFSNTYRVIARKDHGTAWHRRRVSRVAPAPVPPPPAAPARTRPRTPR